MMSKITRSLCLLIGLAVVLTFVGDTAYGQGVAHKKHIVAKHVKRHVKRKIARSTARRRHVRVARAEPIVIPPRDPNKFTILSTPAPQPNYRGPVTGETTYQGAYKSDGTVPKQISGGVLNGKAIALPKPAYPPAAQAVRADGPVAVQVLIDEEGNVISASAISGNPLLRAAAVQAARGAKFPRTLLSGQPVKVSGVITYNFVP